jgi:hypothetical protein
VVPIVVKVMMTNSLEEIIEFFCRNRIPILPCHGIQPDGVCTCRKGSSCPSPGKHPLMFRWQLIATCDKETIMSWIGSGNKPINLAIRTGMRNPENGKYLVGTDLDLIDHPMKQRLERHSKTVTQRSGSGGDHAFYWSKFPVRNSVQLVDEKMDIRGSGGIMIIAPSKHKSGNSYTITCDLKNTEIQDLPEFIEQRLRITVAKKQPTEQQQTPRVAVRTSQAVSFWNERSVTSIKNAMANGEIIPVGARNSTMHRLLSSDRAKGVPTSAKLLVKAKEYLSSFQEPESFLDELDGIVKSVMRYPAYNNSHEKVNELYLGWLGKNGYRKDVDLETLEAMDRMFFDSIEPSSSLDHQVSLEEISQRRAEFLKQAGLTKFATYRSQLLAKKLLGLGIQKRRTAKGNFWLVKFKENPLNLSGASCKNGNMSKSTLNMAEELKNDPKAKGLKNGDIITWKGRKVRVELIETKVPNTEHPREHLYQGRTGYDYNKAMMSLMSRMTEEQMEELAKGPQSGLLMDKEKTVEWMLSVKPGDVIGVVKDLYLVQEPAYPDDFDPDLELFVARAKPVKGKPGTFESVSDSSVPLLTVWELDHARELGLLDILWRDGKPYGIPETRDMTVVLLHDLEEPQSRKKKKNK